MCLCRKKVQEGEQLVNWPFRVTQHSGNPTGSFNGSWISSVGRPHLSPKMWFSLPSVQQTDSNPSHRLLTSGPICTSIGAGLNIHDLKMGFGGFKMKKPTDLSLVFISQVTRKYISMRATEVMTVLVLCRQQNRTELDIKVGLQIHLKSYVCISVMRQGHGELLSMLWRVTLIQASPLHSGDMKTIPYFAEVKDGGSFGSQLELSCQQGPAAAPVGSEYDVTSCGRWH